MFKVLSRRSSRRSIAVALLLTCVMLALAGPTRESAAADDPPTILVIVTDDQRWDTLSTMDQVARLVADPGVTFSNAYATAPSCCPSRSSILTGLYPMHTGVWRNHPPFGGFPAFDDTSTLATWLQAEGFRTGLFGKYLNEYQGPGEAGYTPPGWNRWFAMWGGYYEHTALDDGVLVYGGSQESDYATDVVAERAAGFIRDTIGPLFAYVSFRGVHDPFTPAPRHATMFADLPPWRPASYNERDVSDKPAWVSDRPRLRAADRAAIDEVRADQLRGLQAVDDGVALLIEALRSSGRLPSALIVYTSDNGFTWGEHRLFGKGDPYEESIRVPLLVRYDPVVASPGSIDPRLILNIDIAPTVAAAAGVSVPPVDGRSLISLLGGTAERWRGRFLTMKMGQGQPSFCQLHTSKRTFTLYRTGEEEDYLLSSDPYQLTNVAGTSVGLRRRDVLRRRLLEMCDPLPPDMTAP